MIIKGIERSISRKNAETINIAFIAANANSNGIKETIAMKFIKPNYAQSTAILILSFFKVI